MITQRPSPCGSRHVRNQAVTEPSSSKVVAKPVPPSQVEDPRSYQLGQLQRRFSPAVMTMDDGSTCLRFDLKPSDPDFPFELTQLECDVCVPAEYPEQRPKLRVRNKNIPRGFSINVERGWDRLAREMANATILSIINALDRNLEKLLAEERKDTVKLVAFKDSSRGGAEAVPGAQAKPASDDSARHKPNPRQGVTLAESYSSEQITKAKMRRAQETKQLEARMGRLPRFRRSADGIVFTIPIEPKRRSELPAGLQSANSLHLIVPLLYPLQDLRVQLNEAEGTDAEPVEELFTKKAAEQKTMSLTSHVNYLVQNLHSLARQAQALGLEAQGRQDPEAADVAREETSEVTTAGPGRRSGEEKKHVKIIPRPPEWDSAEDDESSSDSIDDGYNDDDDGDDGDEDDDGAAPEPAAPQLTETQGKGTMLSFPSIELHGIEVLQISILSISAKCERCKTTNDVTGLTPGREKTTSCTKCAAQLSAKFNGALVHQNSSRAGLIEVAGCKVADMLPSTFVATCARCSGSGPGLVSVRGEAVTNVCRECHGRFTFKIPEVKLSLMSWPGSGSVSLAAAAAAAAAATGGPRPRTEKLGLRAGEPLPDKGACVHYRKSFRWFRFSCCSRVHACDRCHDGAEDHVNEWANRMICGWCSREQKYMVEACGFCGRSVIGKRGRGFWEGGKGTRDARVMSRKDPRKYKRLHRRGNKE